MLQVSINHPDNLLFHKYTCQPYAYGASVNYSGNSLCDKVSLNYSGKFCMMNAHLEAFVGYLFLTCILNVNFCEHTMLIIITDPYFHVNFCEHYTYIIFPCSVGLALVIEFKFIVVVHKAIDIL